jgi:hypothetical protein
MSAEKQQSLLKLQKEAKDRRSGLLVGNKYLKVIFDKILKLL